MKRIIDDTVLTNIATTIRSKTGTEQTYQDIEMPQGVEDVYEVGYEKGKAEVIPAKAEQEKTISITQNGTTEVLPDENKVLSKVIINTGVFGDEHYDTFWDTYQQNGKRTNYQYAFSGKGWNDTTFKPKYDISVSGNGGWMFAGSQIKDFENMGY